MKGQVSTELLLIIGFILVLFIPLLLTAYFKTGEMNDKLTVLQAQVTASRIANLANSVGNMGVGSSIILDIYLPETVSNVEINSVGDGGEVVITVNTQNGDVDVVGVSSFPLVKYFEFGGYGNYRIELVASDEGVTVNNVDEIK